MRGRWHGLAGVLLALALGYDLLLWGGLGKIPSYGPIATQAVQREVSLAGFYLPVGRYLVELAGLQDVAKSFAQSTFQPLEARLLANPAAAMETLVADMPWLPRMAYYGAPLLLLAAGVLYWRRPRGVHMISSR
jgi:hypothetical protein